MNITFLEWNDQYSVGSKLIDEQHKRLFELYNKIVRLKQQEHKKQNNEQMPQALKEVIQELSDYVHVHFVTEEEVMKVYQYDEFKEHKKLHDHFAQQVKSLSHDYAAGKFILMDSVIMSIRNWLTHHVMDEDQKYKKFIATSKNNTPT